MLYVITRHEPSSARKAKAGNSGTDSSKDSHHHWPVGPKKEHSCIVQSCILPIFQEWTEAVNTEIILVTFPWMSSASNLYLP